MTEQTNNKNKKRTRCEIWTRVMGYHRPTSHFNIGKRSEHFSRKHFEECVTANSEFCTEYGAAGSVLLNVKSTEASA